jgi:hypothetical protein
MSQGEYDDFERKKKKVEEVLKEMNVLLLLISQKQRCKEEQNIIIFDLIRDTTAIREKMLANLADDSNIRLEIAALETRARNFLDLLEKQ